eukprot:NODE_485_length_7794_cov_0.605848.p3 type:complete len:275 gc:universal NODE_485_length_7794_cov_0.605848:2421-1597(-)
MSEYVGLFASAVVTTFYYGYAFKSLGKYRETHPEADLPIRYMFATLCCMFIAMWDLTMELGTAAEVTYFGFMFVLISSFFGVVFSLVATYTSSQLFTEAYKHVGNAEIGKSLLWGYMIFCLVPLIATVFLSVESFLFVVAGFFFWNFVSDTIMEYLFWKRLRVIKYSIGSDIEASLVALKELKKLFLIKFGVVSLSGLVITGLVFMIQATLRYSNYDPFLLYTTGMYILIISLGFLIPASAIVLKQRLYCASLIPKISLGISVSMQEIQLNASA